MLPGMTRKPRIAIVGAGNLGTALALSLRRAGYSIEAVFARSRASLRKAQKLVKRISAAVFAAPPRAIRADVVWFCVPDAEIGRAAQAFSGAAAWQGRVALHSSGALASDELKALRRQGAKVASVHPMMTFVPGSSVLGSSFEESLTGVPFAIEGDAKAVRVARRIVRDVGGQPYAIRKKDKAAYHAWGTFASPLLVALLRTAEQVAAMAGTPRREARRRMIPILRQTLTNYVTFNAAGAFSGPIIRGDVDTVKQHLRVLKRLPPAYEAYRTLALAASYYLPGRNKIALQRTLRSAGK